MPTGPACWHTCELIYMFTLQASGFRKYSGQFGEADIGGIDRAYRIVADHTRMATVAIADKMYPDHKYVLKCLNHDSKKTNRIYMFVNKTSYFMKCKYFNLISFFL